MSISIDDVVKIVTVLTPIVLAYLAIKQSALKKQTDDIKKQGDEIHVAVNSKSDAYIKEISELKAKVALLEDLPGVVAKLKEVMAVLANQDRVTEEDKREARIKSSLTPRRETSTAPTPVSIVDQKEPVPVEVRDTLPSPPPAPKKR